MYGDEEDENTRNDPQSYFSQALWKRFLIVVAGPLVNFLLAITIVWGLFLTGIDYIAPVVGSVVHSSPAQQAGIQSKDLIVSVNDQPTRSWQQVVMQLMHAVGHDGPIHVRVQHDMQGPVVEKNLALWELDFNKSTVDPLQELGIAPYYPPIKPIVDRVVKNSPADRAGLVKGATILAINGKPISDWQQLVMLIQEMPGKKMTWTTEFRGKKSQKQVVIGEKRHQGEVYGYVGFSVEAPEWPKKMQLLEHYGPFSGWAPAWKRVWGLLTFQVGVLFKLVVGDLPMKVMGGPVSIFQAAGKATLAGWQVYWQFVAIISLSIGFINLLPIPGLDGGHILYQLVELLRRRPLSLKIQRAGVIVGMLFLVIFMIQVTFYDLGRLFNF
jgi:regulator of sigma E protease